MHPHLSQQHWLLLGSERAGPARGAARAFRVAAVVQGERAGWEQEGG